MTEEHEHAWVCVDAGENWDKEGTYFDRFEQCDIEGCELERHVRYRLEVLSTHQSE